MMDLPNMRGTKTEVKIHSRFNGDSKFLTAQANAQTANPDGKLRCFVTNLVLSS